MPKRASVHGYLLSFFSTNVQTDAKNVIELDTNLLPLKMKSKVVKRRAVMSLSEKLASLYG